MSDKQVAFVSMLHGAAQGIVSSAMADSSCSKEERTKVKGMLNKSKGLGLERY